MNSDQLNPPVPSSPFDTYRKQSPLHACGYKVGVSAPLRSTRERILLRFFRADLRSRFDSPDYEELGASEWGAPGSPKRWQRMLYHLSWQRERQGAQGRGDAARHLDEDLAYVERPMLIEHLEESSTAEPKRHIVSRRARRRAERQAWRSRRRQTG